MTARSRSPTPRSARAWPWPREEDFGERVALAAARELVVYLKRTGGQMQFSEPLQLQMRSVDRFADLASWMIRNLRGYASADAFRRAFERRFGIAPSLYRKRFSSR